MYLTPILNSTGYKYNILINNLKEKVGFTIKIIKTVECSHNNL